jgi:hypothetical protein
MTENKEVEISIVFFVVLNKAEPAKWQALLVSPRLYAKV